jgi:hypothetical protein
LIEKAIYINMNALFSDNFRLFCNFWRRKRLPTAAEHYFAHFEPLCPVFAQKLSEKETQNRENKVIVEREELDS